MIFVCMFLKKTTKKKPKQNNKKNPRSNTISIILRHCTNANVVHAHRFTVTRPDPRNIMPQFWSKVFLLVITEIWWQLVVLFFLFFSANAGNTSFFPYRSVNEFSPAVGIGAHFKIQVLRCRPLCGSDLGTSVKTVEIYAIWCDNTILLFQM